MLGLLGGIIGAVGVATGAMGAATGAMGAAAVAMGNIIKPYYTTEETMLILGMSRTTILKKMKEKKLKYEGKGGRGGYRFKKEDIIKYAQNNNITPNWEALNTSLADSDFNSQDVVRIKHDAEYLEIQIERCKIELRLLRMNASDDKKVIEENKRKELLIKLKLADIMESIVKYKAVLSEQRNRILGATTDTFALEPRDSLNFDEDVVVEMDDKKKEIFMAMLRKKDLTRAWQELREFNEKFRMLMYEAQELMDFDINQSDDSDISTIELVKKSIIESVKKAIHESIENEKVAFEPEMVVDAFIANIPKIVERIKANEKANAPKNLN